jgi:hypothetical protein
MRQSMQRREGFALAVAIFAIVVIGGIVAGAFFASNQDYKIGRNTLLQERALAASEYGLNQTIAQWDVATNTSLAVGATTAPKIFSLTAQTGGTADQATVRLTRLSDLTFWVVSEGQVGTGVASGARKRTSSILKLYVPQINILGALTVRGALKIGGSSSINGNDVPPAGWACNAPKPSKPGIAAGDASQITTSGCSVSGTDYSCVTGSPDVKTDPLATKDSTYFEFGGVSWNDLVASANFRISGSPRPAPSYNADGTCNKGDQGNWGDVNRNPLLPGKCEGYFPIIYSPGDIDFQGGKGQGILLVEGDLKVTGGFEFYGPVIVKGKLVTSGTGGHFNGGVMAANVEFAQNSVLGDALINYSSCAVAAAVMGSTLPTPAIQRAWADMF